MNQTIYINGLGQSPATNACKKSMRHMARLVRPDDHTPYHTSIDRPGDCSYGFPKGWATGLRC